MQHTILDGGIKVTLFDPPPEGFDPFAASPADLQRHGFPCLPTDPHRLDRYKRVFGQIRTKFHYIQPTFRVNADKVHGPRVRRPEAGTETSTNWSGGGYAPSGQSFKSIEGDWVVPDVGAPTQKEWYYCANWIGIDGDQSGDVCQAGVECNVYQNGTSVSRNIYPWWEWYPAGEVQITNLQINPGDMITMVLKTTQGAGSTSATVS